MKILLVSDTYPPDVNGAAYFTFRLGIGLSKKGHEVHVMAPAVSWNDEVSDECGMRLHRVRSLPTPFHTYFRFCPPFLATNRVARLIEQIAPDVIHVQNHFLLGRAAIHAAKKQKIPLVGTNHFMPDNLIHFLHLPHWLEVRVMKLAWKQFSHHYQSIDCITTPTKTAADLLREVGFSREVQAISCGIDTELFHPRNQDHQLKKRFALPEDRPILLYVGRLDAEKRIPVVLRAVARVLSRQKVHLLVVGRGPQKEQLVALSQTLGISDAVTFTGFVSDGDLPKIYSLADLFVMASVAELQSIATMEAMATGLPVIGANILALPELVHDGENGYVFPPNDDAALAVCMLNILTNPLRRMAMGKESLKIIQAHHADATIRAFEAIYERVMGLHR